MKKILIALLLLVSLSAVAQRKSKKEVQAPPVNYYDSALLKKAAGDHCGYCAFLIKATTFSNTMSSKQYGIDCMKVDTIHYQEDSVSGSRRYSVIIEVPCTGNKEQTFYISEPGKTRGYSFTILGPDGQLRTDQLKEFPEKETDKLTFIYIMTEDMPAYNGGDEARTKFLQQNMRYPEEAKENRQQGKVFVTFIVNENGVVSDVKVRQGVSKSIDSEALRVIGMMSSWSPGKINGKPVKCQIILPIKFTLQ